MKELSYKKLLFELREIGKECSKRNWDGYNALPISKESIFLIEIFITKLPLHYTFPIISPLPNGRMGLEWNIKNNTLLISIDDVGILYWNALINNKEIEGIINLTSGESLREVYNIIEKF